MMAQEEPVSVGYQAFGVEGLFRAAATDKNSSAPKCDRNPTGKATAAHIRW